MSPAIMTHYKLQHVSLTIFLLSICYSMSFAYVDNTLQPKVTIPQGTLLGNILTTRHGRNVSAFVRIPYAQPPIGNLRFANPVRANGWNGTLNASVEPTICPEISENGIVGDEDCLYLKVFTPQTVSSSLLPVMVFIHGGGFRTNFLSHSGPEYLLDGDVVFVTFQYRVGPLGFLSTGDEVASGNWGLKDQVLALKWVQDNVRYFGGDPNQVTLFGISAGAGAVHLLTLSNSTVGLFHRYITQSGSAVAKWACRPKAVRSSQAFKLGEFVGCHNDTSESLINCLRTINSTVLLSGESGYKVWEFLPDVRWGPTDEPDIEGAVLTDSPSNIFAAGKIRDLPWMTGVVGDEGLLYSSRFYTNKTMLYDFMANIDTLLPLFLLWTDDPDSGAAWVKATKSYYFNNDLRTNSTSLVKDEEILKNFTMLIGDAFFYYPIHKCLRRHHDLALNPQYFYSFDYRGTYSFSYFFGGGTEDHGVTHADDMIYLFSTGSTFADLNKTMSQSDYEMIDTMVQLWTSFATNGKPTASALGNTTWKPYSSAEGNYLKIGNHFDRGLGVQYSFLKERMQFWSSIDVVTET